MGGGGDSVGDVGSGLSFLPAAETERGEQKRKGKRVQIFLVSSQKNQKNRGKRKNANLQKMKRV